MLLRSGTKLNSLTMEDGGNVTLPVGVDLPQVDELLNDGVPNVDGEGVIPQVPLNDGADLPQVDEPLNDVLNVDGDGVIPQDGLLNGQIGGVPQNNAPLNNGAALDGGIGGTRRSLHSPKLKPDDVASRIADDAVHRFVSQADAVTDDIYDFLDENPIDEIRGNVSDLDRNVSKMEELRSQYRTLHRELKRLLPGIYEAEYGHSFRETLEAVKEYIKDAKKERVGLRSREADKTDGDKLRKSQSVKLMIDNGERIVTELEGQFAEPLESMTDQELSRRIAELPEIIRKVDSIASKFPDMMTNCKDLTDESMVNKFMEKYKKFLVVKDKYISNVRKTSEEKEFDKEKKFKEASLNIKLGKFSGYNSNKDLYTFKDEFEKLYLRQTPSRMLPDLLKNNFLDGPALTLVKHVDEMDEIWKRLKKTYGDPKVLLSNKLDELGKMDMTKSKDSEKTMDSLHKMIATMNDLIKMSKKHGIANELFYGDGFERILRLLDDRRATKWITDSCDLELTKEQMWEDLIKFLQKEANVLQQRSCSLVSPLAKMDPLIEDCRITT